MRGGLPLAAALLACSAAAQDRSGPAVVSAELQRPTDRYAHAVLGDALEWGALEITWAGCAGCADRQRSLIVLPESRVFEDVQARVADADGDGLPEVIVVETDLRRGAALAVYGPQGRRGITPFLGAPNRWLAPAGVGDFDGDGRPEIAWVERPHVDRVLVIGRLAGDRIRVLARAEGFSNHRIGETAITGSVHACPGGDRLVLPDAGWRQWQEVWLQGGRMVVRDAGPVSSDPVPCGG
jgi:hypothetical protein